MAKKTVSFKTKGMNRDLSVSAFNPEFSFENMNLRLSTNEGNTMMSWVNEKGTTKELDCDIITDIWADENTDYTHEHAIKGIPIGTAVIDSTLVIFTTEGKYPKVGFPGQYNFYDIIYALKYNYKNGSFNGEMLYKGHLNFSFKHPLETIVSYESSKVQKVYWTDGYNQPRLINICADYAKIKKWNHDGNPSDGIDTFFDFVPDLQLNETVKVKKLLGANGSFAPGVIQYAFTYYNKYGQESNIFYTTPLYYISYNDRGASPEDTSIKNAFKITVSNVDTNFDYLRIYSIQRTSINGTPIAKRIQDIQLSDGTTDVSFTDTGTTGNTVDPTELLYKGGESIKANTFCQKDNTLFLGNLELARPYVYDSVSTSGDDIEEIRNAIDLNSGTRVIYPTMVSRAGYYYDSQLTSYNDDSYSVPCAGFKLRGVYRLGVQFQYKDGKWSNPVWINDFTVTNNPGYSSGNGKEKAKVTLPVIKGTLTKEVADKLIQQKFKRIRGVVVFPSVQDRTALCQGVVCPTLFTKRQSTIDKNLQAQSSWFFRTIPPTIKNPDGASSPNDVQADGTACPSFGDTGSSTGKYLPYTESNKYPNYNPNNIKNHIKAVEVQGSFDDEDKFQINRFVYTLHSPDIEFSDYLSLSDLSDTKYMIVGKTKADHTLSDIDIQTESPAISNTSSGFVHKSFDSDGMHGIISGLFYDDYIVDDKDADKLQKYDKEGSPCKWMVYLWNKSGSLNNDINREADKGTASAILKKKVVSNLRFCNPTDYVFADQKNQAITSHDFDSTPQVFNSDVPSIIKLYNNIYMGNIDTLINPDHADGMYFSFNGSSEQLTNNSSVITNFGDPVNYRTWSEDADTAVNQGIWAYSNGTWSRVNGDVGDHYLDLVMKKNGVRMKYKSTPHIVFAAPFSNYTWESDTFPVVEVVRELSEKTIFGGTSQDALKENNWVPCGEPVSLNDINEGKVHFEYSYGDTYFQRWDCLKTYPYTNEDINQVVEIGSFMLETYVNIDGRYDRNRGQVSNINMSPVNFNLLNPVYSQIDNFFTYKILDDDDYSNSQYPNQITWTQVKANGADVDLWTNITLASTLELDGDKGSVNRLVRFNDQLLAFQDTGISQILYNENVQVSSTQGVPIEIANSGKVQGSRYISNTIGCSDKWALAVSPSGIYFMDNYDKGIYFFNGQLQNLSLSKGFNSWVKQNAKNPSVKWTPFIENENTGFDNFTACYDRANQDILFINRDLALAYSERAGAFTSFYDYGGIPYLVNIDDIGIWVKPNLQKVKTQDVNSQDTEYVCSLYGHNMGGYCNFFGTQKPYWMTIIANPEPQTSKVFTNLELRATVDGDSTEALPFDNIEVWNEYQHGIQPLANKTGIASMQHYAKDEASALKRKFRIWRADIPRDNALLGDDAGLNISRLKPKPLDRIRNPWIYMKLKKDNPASRAEIHDIVLTYFN